MSVLLDPQGNETAVLHHFLGDLQGKRVLEIGCGDGRLTWRYAHQATFVQAIDPDSQRIARAQAKIPPELQGRLLFQAVELNDLPPTEPFDWVLLSWSL